MTKLQACSVVFLVMFLPISGYSQSKFLLGPEYGHTWFSYKYEDFGGGFINKSRANNKFFIGAKLKYFAPEKNIFVETGLFYCSFQQYYSTKYYVSAWEERYPVISLPLKIGKEFFKEENRFNISSSVGLSFNFLPEQYKADLMQL